MISDHRADGEFPLWFPRGNGEPSATCDRYRGTFKVPIISRTNKERSQTCARPTGANGRYRGPGSSSALTKIDSGSRGAFCPVPRAILPGVWGRISSRRTNDRSDKSFMSSVYRIGLERRCNGTGVAFRESVDRQSPACRSYKKGRRDRIVVQAF